MKNTIHLLVISIAASATAHAAFVPINSPVPLYLASTTYIDFSSIPDLTQIASITDGTQTVNWDITHSKRTVPTTWTSWSVSPDSQRGVGEPLPVAYTQEAESITITLALPTETFGFEAEPNEELVHTMTTEFFMGATSLGTITRDVNGNAGARLFAASVGAGEFITHVVFGTDDFFATGAYRYGVLADPAVPEPATYVLTASALGLFGLLRRRRLSRSAARNRSKP